MTKREIPYYQDYVSTKLLKYLVSESKPVPGVPDLVHVGSLGGLETTKSLRFLCDLYDATKGELNKVLEQRISDRKFIDQRTLACYELNKSLEIDFLDEGYQTLIGQEDATGRIVIGPKNEFYCKSGGGTPIAKIPDFLQGPHVTLFGPPDDPKLSINAMNAYHRKLKNEPAIVAELLATHTSSPKWGADDEDSKTPLRPDLISAGENLTHCFEKTISYIDPKTKKEYRLEKDHLALPIKRFPGLALPCLFLFFRNNPLPLHLYDFALHLFRNWKNPEALAFYVPKLETEEEARYIRILIETAEQMIHSIHPEYKMFSIRLLIVLENPRAVFRTNEIMDALHPYFAGASLGWHDYLASTARLFKEDPNYRIPVKADPNIVIKYIKASHDLLANVVGSRGGIKIGGMYGILPMDTDLASPSFQVTMKGFIKDVITQLKRNLSGFWVAHPDFVRLGLAMVEAWKFHQNSDKTKLETLVTSLLDKKYHHEILSFINGPDLVGLDISNPLYQRSLLVADIKESTYIANNDPEEIRYNVFQSLQYLTDWLSGNGCVALPTQIEGIPARVMDDLATAERSRWEVWHELHHGRFTMEEFLKIAHEELHFIRKDLSNAKKIVQVKWDERTKKWYPIALNLMILLMTSDHPVEFAPELLLPFTIDSLRKAENPWLAVTIIEPEKYQMKASVERFNYYFSVCGSLSFASLLAKNLALDMTQAEEVIKNFKFMDLLEAANFHGDIGESKRTLDRRASEEQALVLKEAPLADQLTSLGKQYQEKFGLKFLISAQGKTGKELLSALTTRMENSPLQELENARLALWEITKKRFLIHPLNDLQKTIETALRRHQVNAAQVSIATAPESLQSLAFGCATIHTWFEMASLSKSVASCFAIEYFHKANIPLTTSVNSIFAKTTSSFRIKSLDPLNPQWGDQVQLAHLMNHTALNMHYVNGTPADQAMPELNEVLPRVGVINEPGTKFQYSGAGFLVLEHLLESLEYKNIQTLTRPFLDQLGLKDFSFEQKNLPNIDYAHGYLINGEEVPGTRKMFPALAAGAMGTATAMSHFLGELTKAFHQAQGTKAISHNTAVQMLFGSDKGCKKFMGTKMGLGIFTAEAGPNRLAIHQGANDGFRGLFVHCYDGPSTGLGFSILCNAELNGVLFIAETAQAILSEFRMEGIDPSLFKKNFITGEIPQEEVVNIGYRDLIFGAFKPDLPEEIITKGPLDSLAAYNLAIGGKILEVSNQGFARAENLLSAYLPIFDPGLFGRQGKIMDSWESVRHNQGPCDEMIFELKKSSPINYVGISTKYHLGNQAQFVRIEGLNTETKQWQDLIEKTELQGHAFKAMKTSTGTAVFSQVKVSIYPDGGLSRLGLYNETLPETEKSKYLPPEQAKSVIFTDTIPQTLRSLAPKYDATESNIKKNWANLKPGAEVDVASAAFGGHILSATNEHYGPATQVISPFPPLHMFDGMESARSRRQGHTEEVIIALGRPAILHRIEIDFTYFTNNNPLELSIQGFSESGWTRLVDKINVKGYAANKIVFDIKNSTVFSQLKLITHPDGGLNRVKALSNHSIF
jgi:allantoicase/malate synthase